MKNIRKWLAGIFIAIASVCIGFSAGLLKEDNLGNSAFVPQHRNCVTSSSTTTRTYMLAGYSTTTVSCNLNVPDSTVSWGYISDSATLAIQAYGTSTAASTINGTIEYSNDGIDWYQNQLSALATTTAKANIYDVQSFTMITASSTGNTQWNDGGIIGGSLISTSTSYKVIDIPTPMKYVRVVFTVPQGSNPAEVWAEIIPKFQSVK